MNILYSPERFGLEAFATIEWPAEDYDFYITAVWKQGDTFLCATDSGCSCPTPFDDFTVDQLETISSLDQFQEYCDARGSNRTPQIVAILERLYQAGLR